jgi:hypothetical protein
MCGSGFGSSIVAGIGQKSDQRVLPKGCVVDGAEHRHKSTISLSQFPPIGKMVCQPVDICFATDLLCCPDLVAAAGLTRKSQEVAGSRPSYAKESEIFIGVVKSDR